jgi:hypothetical protein
VIPESIAKMPTYMKEWRAVFDTWWETYDSPRFRANMRKELMRDESSKMGERRLAQLRERGRRGEEV